MYENVIVTPTFLFLSKKEKIEKGQYKKWYILIHSLPNILNIYFVFLAKIAKNGIMEKKTLLKIRKGAQC